MSKFAALNAAKERLRSKRRKRYNGGAEAVGMLLKRPRAANVGNTFRTARRNELAAVANTNRGLRAYVRSHSRGRGSVAGRLISKPFKRFECSTVLKLSRVRSMEEFGKTPSPSPSQIRNKKNGMRERSVKN